MVGNYVVVVSDELSLILVLALVRQLWTVGDIEGEVRVGEL